MTRPPYRAFYDAGQPIRWHHVNADGTPGAACQRYHLAEIGIFMMHAIIDGETWVADFFHALKTNGKANLRGSE